jgi:hypothetical protein
MCDPLRHILKETDFDEIKRKHLSVGRLMVLENRKEEMHS